MQIAAKATPMRSAVKSRKDHAPGHNPHASPTSFDMPDSVPRRAALWSREAQNGMCQLFGRYENSKVAEKQKKMCCNLSMPRISSPAKSQFSWIGTIQQRKEAEILLKISSSLCLLMESFEWRSDMLVWNLELFVVGHSGF